MVWDITNKSKTHYWNLASYGTYEDLARLYPVFKSVFPKSADSKLFTEKGSAIIRGKMREFLRSKGITNLSKLPKPTEINYADKIESLIPGLKPWEAYAITVANKIVRTGGRIRIC